MSKRNETPEQREKRLAKRRERDRARRKRQLSGVYVAPNNSTDYTPKSVDELDAKRDEIEAEQLREHTHSLRGALAYLAEVQFGGIVEQGVHTSLRNAEKTIASALDRIGKHYRELKDKDRASKVKQAIVRMKD